MLLFYSITQEKDVVNAGKREYAEILTENCLLLVDKCRGFILIFEF